MRLKHAARYFDRDSVYDAYTNVYLFKAQMLSPAEHVSGDTFKRHTLTTKDGITMPARNAVRIVDGVWLTANNNADTHDNEVIRRNFALKKSTGLLQLMTPAEACTNTGGLAIHAHKEFYRDTVNIPTEADYATFWNIYCPQNENVLRGSFFRQGTTVFRVRNVYPTPEGFNVAESDQFYPDAIQAATFITTGKPDLVSDKRTAASVAASVIQTDVYKFYRFTTADEDKQKAGDRTVFVPKATVTPVIGGKLAMLGKTWQIMTIASEFDSWALHVRLS